MFNANKIKLDLYGVVGCRQPFNPDYAIIDADNQVSTSNLFVTDNPNCKIEYLKDSQDYDSISDADFNTKLKRMQENSIVKVGNAIFDNSSYIDRQVLYKNPQNRVETEDLTSGFVSHKIDVSSQKNVAFEITRVLLNFEGAGDIKLMLFDSNQDAPINEKVITISSTNQVEVLNWVVDNSGDTYKGEYYLGYLTNYVDIGTLKPFKREYNDSNIESDICHLDIRKVQFKGHSTETLPDLSSDEGLSEATGLNPDITVYNDYTDLMIQNKRLLATAINYAFQIEFIQVYIATLRINTNSRNAQAQAARLVQSIEGVRETDSNVKVTGLLSLMNTCGR